MGYFSNPNVIGGKELEIRFNWPKNNRQGNHSGRRWWSRPERIHADDPEAPLWGAHGLRRAGGATINQEQGYWPCNPRSWYARAFRHRRPERDKKASAEHGSRRHHWYGTLKDAQEALRLGAGDFISKPYNVADIISIVAKSFQRREYNLRIKSLLLGGIQSFRSTVNDVHKNYQILSICPLSDII